MAVPYSQFKQHFSDTPPTPTEPLTYVLPSTLGHLDYWHSGRISRRV